MATRSLAGIARILGNGPVDVLVLHGWTLDSSVWHSTDELINVAKFKYGFLDFPGYGIELARRPAQGIDAMAKCALAAADALGWQRFAVLGHSMGGSTALRVATLAPERVSSVVALTPVSPGGTPLDEDTYRAFKGMWPDCGSALRQVGPHLSESQVQKMEAASRDTMTRATWEAYLDNWTGANFASSLSDYRGSATLVVGESDPLVTVSYLQSTVQALSGAKLETLSGSGHYPMLEQSVRAVELWESHLR